MNDVDLKDPQDPSDGIQITDTLDLHGFFPEQIPDILTAFLNNAHELNLSRLRIIHGKGKSRLKWETREFLKTRTDVAGYHDAPPEEGHWGATVVQLKD